MRHRRRTTAEVDELAERLFAYIAKNQGWGIEVIAIDLRLRVKECRVPLLRLLAAGRIVKSPGRSSRGRRSRYSLPPPAAAAPPAPAP